MAITNNYISKKALGDKGAKRNAEVQDFKRHITKEDIRVMRCALLLYHNVWKGTSG